MAVIPETTECRGCGKMVWSVWQTSKGNLCDECLVKKIPLKQALEDTCACCHSKIKELYSSAKSKRKK